MQARRLTPTSYIVLGLIEHAGEATPYELKRMVATSVGEFWSLQHAQLYSEPKRLTESGHLTETRERDGRRRRRYRITASGREALARWRSEPTAELAELREPALLKLFFGADPDALADVQVDALRRKLVDFERLADSLPADLPAGPGLALEAGIRHARESIAFWEDLRRRDARG